MLQSQPPNSSNTILLLRSLNPLPPGTVINSITPSLTSSHNFTSPLIIPFNNYLQYRSGSDIAQIDVRPLMQYPEYQHHLHITPYNEKTPFSTSSSPQVQLVLQFIQFIQQQSKSLIPIRLILHSAQLKHDTETIGKMDPYVKIFVNGIQKYRSKTVKSGNKTPNFNQQAYDLDIRSVSDKVRFEVWDDDTITKDDLVGAVQLPVYQLLGRVEIIDVPLAYEKRGKNQNAGVLIFQAKSARLY